MANEEECVKGRFWEGHFKSQALLDEAALLSCMVYVDLNPVRAAIESDVVSSDFTSIQQRIYDYAQTHSDSVEDVEKLESRIEHQRAIKEELELDKLPEAQLMAFGGSSHIDIHHALPFTLQDYFDLIDVTGRLVRADKRGSVDAKLPPLVNRLGIDPDKWLDHVRSFGHQYGACAGSVTSIRDYAHRHNRKWSKGVAAISKLAFEVIPQDPTLPEYRQGNTLGVEHKLWFRVKFFQQYRLFFRFDSSPKIIVYAWVNDEKNKRAYGSKSDAYRVFEKMLQNGHPPDEWSELLGEARGGLDRLNQLAKKLL
ncbi:Toxin YhaV [Marinobacterium sp. xm-d-420]|uniref:type II toxin-antitoxin system YhaV family toxin n=1 Tax=Marinobacterium sp. xm-d-420 TaxID=2497737 RepID=UPI001A07E400|nr:type II toxin-antitoxin system YhaV family toxin [Marinobacterium sp. xm-d-420]NRP26541.1 Toxin YhaV [Marinobacterium sp. xm-d-420]